MTAREKDFHMMKHASPKQTEVGLALGLLHPELLCISEGETGYFQRMPMQSSVQTEASTTHNWVIYYNIM